MHVTTYVGSLTNDMYLYKHYHDINKRSDVCHDTFIVHRYCPLQDCSGILTYKGELPFMLVTWMYDTRANLQGVQGSRLNLWVQIKPSKLLNQLRLPAAFCSAP